MSERSVFQTLFVLLIVLVVSGCSGPDDLATEAMADVDWARASLPDQPEVSWLEDVQPILEQRCVVCHGCYDAPCQLKLTSYAGLTRGANPAKVYDGTRVRAARPTRMFIDGQTDEDWRLKGFHSVLAVADKDGVMPSQQQSVLYRMLRHKQLNPQPRSGRLPDSVTLSLGRKQVCSAQDKMSKFERKNPLWGMPYGMPNLSDREYRTLTRWLAQGAPGPAEPPVTTADDQLVDWETFLNGTSPKEQLMSRYIYEHLFLAHIHFEGAGEREFYRLVRSYTPPGEPIAEIPTVRPFDDPGVEQFWYRLRLYDASIVAKSHVIYQFSASRLERYRELFLQPEYTVDALPDYRMPVTANPFKTFAAIPSHSRYVFLLDDARFFIQGFIKGPVCRGQVALNVIEDHFWVMFADPDVLKLELAKDVLAEAQDYLKMPMANDTLEMFAAYRKFWDSQKNYMALKAREFDRAWPTSEEAAFDLIWDGEGQNPNAALTIFRNFDSAAVEFGLRGQFPDTAWVINFTLFERIHYLLVAGFDVYGNAGHQLNTRLFMDFLRMEGEDNFLYLLPAEDRQKIRAKWYEGLRAGRAKYFAEPEDWMTRESPIVYRSDDTQSELYSRLLGHLGPIAGPADDLNRCRSAHCDLEGISAGEEAADTAMRRLAAIRGERLRGVPELIFVRVALDNGEALSYSVIHNREWKNITSFLEGAEKAQQNRDPSGDTLTVLRDFSGSYPNFFFRVEEGELDAFVRMAEVLDGRQGFEAMAARFGVRRTADNFWDTADWFQTQYMVERPVEAGILDLNRYGNR